MGDVTVRFKPAPGPLQNPLKGWCSYTDAGKIYHPYAMVFRYVSWKDIEPEPGVFAFEEWEKKTWNVPAAQGRHIVFRVMADYPSQPSGLPDWLRAKGVTETPYTQFGGGKSPDYNHPEMVAAMERLILALGARYDTHPRVAFLQLGILGHWGEWHTYPKDELFASDATQVQVVEAYKAAFPNKKIMARYAKNYPGKMDWLGYHDDYFPEDTGIKEDWHFLYHIRRSGRAENWKRAVIGGEMVPHDGNNARKWMSKEHFPFTLQMAEEAHFSWIGPYSPALEEAPDADYPKRCQQLVRRMGYQYRLKELRHPDRVKRNAALNFTLTAENEGVAPFYYPWQVQLALLTEKDKRVVAQKTLPGTDIRTWLPGKFVVKDGVAFPEAAPGKYRLALGILDPWTKKPAVTLANDLPQTKDGWILLSQIRVL